MSRRLRRRLVLLALAVLLAAAFLILHPVRVIGPSMRPALMHGDLLLAVPTWLLSAGRNDLVLLEEPDTGATVVKRIVGLPGESVQLVGQDLLINGARLDPGIREVEQLVPLVDATGEEMARLIDLRSAGFQLDDGRWRLEGEGMARLVYPLKDGFLAGGKLNSGQRQAEDLGVELSFRREGEEAVVELHLQEQGDVFKLILDQGGRRASLVREAEVRELLHQKEFTRAVTEGTLFLSNVDRMLVATINGRELVRERYGVGQARPRLPPDVHITRLAVGGHGPLSLSRVRIGRDLLRVPAGTHGTAEALHLGRDAYFVLGDDPNTSRDSRQYGAVPGDRIRARVVGRLWPPGSLGMGWGR